MNQAVTAQDHVSGRKWLADDVAILETPAFIAMQLLVPQNQVGDNVYADILFHLVRDGGRPIEITTRRIQQAANSQPAQTVEKLIQELGCTLTG